MRAKRISLLLMLAALSAPAAFADEPQASSALASPSAEVSETPEEATNRLLAEWEARQIYAVRSPLRHTVEFPPEASERADADGAKEADESQAPAD